jgi:hypothetical protein
VASGGGQKRDLFEAPTTSPTMTATPFATRAMHLDDVSMSSFGTPFTAAAPASMDFLNAQLVAHGFTHGHGLNLSDLRGKDQGTVLKCLANMLGQRMVSRHCAHPSSYGGRLDAFWRVF